MMRAKMQVQSVTRHAGYQTGCEVVKMTPVCSSGFGPNGESEDNTFARYTPSGSLELTITNPALIGQLNPGDKFYVDFTKVET